MADFPALPLWTDAYLSDTTHLSAEEHGAYLLLLLTAWRSADCSLPDDDRVLSRICRLTERRWMQKVRPAVAGFFTIAEGAWRQKRLQKEREKVEIVRAKRREARAMVGGAKPLENNEAPPTNVTTNDQTLVRQSISISISKAEQQQTNVPPGAAVPPEISWQDLGRSACRAAGIDDDRIAVDFSECIAWVRAKYDPATVVATIEAIARRTGYKPPRSLKYFSRAIAEAHLPPEPGERRKTPPPPTRAQTEAEKAASDEWWLKIARIQAQGRTWGDRFYEIPPHIKALLAKEQAA
jgi:uncharacterized protein YdaU (DUF1376 family)